MPCPRDLVDLHGSDDEPVWVADAKPTQRQLVVLGTPLGCAEFVQAHTAQRLDAERAYLTAIESVADLQAAWILLVKSAVPRAEHLTRVLPPSASREYAEGHDAAVWATFCRLLGAKGYSDDTMARHVASLPCRMGGLGLRSAARQAEGAHLAGWLDAMPALQDRAPTVAASIIAEMSQEAQPTSTSLRELRTATDRIAEVVPTQLPRWAAAAAGAAEPPPEPEPDQADPGERRRGWQHHICSHIETHFREQVVWPTSDASRRAMLRSASGRGAGQWLSACPTHPQTTMRPLRMQVALRRRLRWPLPIGPRR